MRFRPCIDLHDGKVKQIVGSTMKDNNILQVNFESTYSSSYFASLYKKNGLKGGHVIKLGAGNDLAAEEALTSFPDNLQIGGGIIAKNAKEWLAKGASHVIVTSAIFEAGKLLMDKLLELVDVCGKEHLVIDLSCGRKDSNYVVMTDRWRHYSEVKINRNLFDRLAPYCDEFLIHAVDVEGKQKGLDKNLIEKICPVGEHRIVYAGGIHTLEEIKYLRDKSEGKLDFSIGSSLDIFGGHLKYQDIIKEFA